MISLYTDGKKCKARVLHPLMRQVAKRVDGRVYLRWALHAELILLVPAGRLMA